MVQLGKARVLVDSRQGVDGPPSGCTLPGVSGGPMIPLLLACARVACTRQPDDGLSHPAGLETLGYFD